MGSPFHNERKLLTDFYMWMVENNYDHNIRIRVENKAELFLRERGENEIESTKPQLQQADVSGQVCIDCGKNKAKYCWDCLCSHVNG